MYLASFMGLSRGQRFGQLANPIPMHDTSDVCFAVAAAGENAGERLQIRNGIEVAGRLLRAVAAVEVAAYAAVPGASRELADVIDVVSRVGNHHASVLRRRFA